MNDYDIHYGAKPNILAKAKELRQIETKAEQLLWRNLRNRKLNGLKFRRQHPIDIYIADFYCHEINLVIEVDGEIHNYQTDYDIGRTVELNKFGIAVIRFTNEEVEKNIECVLDSICNMAKLRKDKIA